ncbi:hypothetical protein F5Y09DRAFT_355271 [Xylaria sp. FL1042]|nr:hypothetical protein F5Y09DRAFT_355271 [Xylaria sp. FL1042]
MADTTSNVSLLFYRKNSSGEYEALVRYAVEDEVYNVPYHELGNSGSTTACAHQIAQTSLGLRLTQSEVDVVKGSVEVSSSRDSTCVFLIQTTPALEAIIRSGNNRGWIYTFIPVASLVEVFLTPKLDVTGEVIKAALDKKETMG